MAVLIKDGYVDSLIREMAARTGETLTEAVKIAAEERLARMPALADRIDRSEVDRVLARIRSYPVTDTRNADDILGYDENGLPS